MNKTLTLEYVQRSFGQFRAAHDEQNFGLAYDAFVQALWAAPDIAFRYFLVRASRPIDEVMRITQKGPQLATWLDGMLADFPNMHAFVDYDSNLIERIVRLRESNIEKGLPSVVMVTQGKSASVPVSNIFNSGFNSPLTICMISGLRCWRRMWA